MITVRSLSRLSLAYIGAAFAYGQNVSGTISGTVVDAQHASINGSSARDLHSHRQIRRFQDLCAEEHKSRSRSAARFDAFNVFNHTEFSTINNTLTFANPSNATPTNTSALTATGAINTSQFGSVSGVQSPRQCQVTLHIRF